MAVTIAPADLLTTIQSGLTNAEKITNPYDKANELATIQIAATLYLAEQQRIAYSLALLTTVAAHPGIVQDFALRDVNWRALADAVREAIK